MTSPQPAPPQPPSEPAHQPTVVWRDGQLVPFEQATVHVLSHAVARGSMVFDVIPVVELADGPAAVGLRPHMSRFLRSGELMGMDELGSLATLERAVAEVVLANRPSDGSAPTDASIAKIMALWAEEPQGVVPADLAPTVLASSVPFQRDRRFDDPIDPVAVMTGTVPKTPTEVLPVGLKVAAAYAPSTRDTIRAHRLGFDAVVSKTPDGLLAESATASVLVVAGGRMLAPPLDSVLDGVTRRMVIDLAHHLDVPVEIRAVDWEEVEGADELLMCSATGPGTPIARLDDRRLDAPGPITAELGRHVRELLRGRHPLSGAWLTPLAPLVG